MDDEYEITCEGDVETAASLAEAKSKIRGMLLQGCDPEKIRLWRRVPLKIVVTIETGLEPIDQEPVKL